MEGMSMIKGTRATALIGLALLMAGTVPAMIAGMPVAAAQEKRKPPYFASIAAGQARMRTGPARTYPASWLYRRADLPVRVVAIYKDWRRVEDPDGETGWMLANLLHERRTALVRSAAPADLRDRPSIAGRVVWRAAPGVVGRLSQCGDGWCRFDVRGQAGYAAIGDLWGVDAGEILP